MARLDAGLDLLDREIVDAEGEAVGKVDDVELTNGGPGTAPEIVALLMGPAAYGRRFGGRLGRWIERIGAKLAETPEPIRFPMTEIAEIDVSIKLKATLDSLDRPTRVEAWLRDRFIGRIPGANRESE